MTRLLRALVWLSALLLPLAAQAHEYEVGQVWEYRTAEGDEDSLIRIQQIEFIGPNGEMEVFHISMINIRLEDGSLMPEIMHLPVSERTLDGSVTALSDSDAAFPDHREGLAQWREANGGVFTITLAEIADTIRIAMAQANSRK